MKKTKVISPSGRGYRVNGPMRDVPAQPQAVMNPQLLQPGVDYLYCPVCGHHVASIRLQPGIWELQCPRCVGECGLCSCQSQGACFGKDGVPVQTHMYVAESSKAK